MWLTTIKMWGGYTVFETHSMGEADKKVNEWIEKTKNQISNLVGEPWEITHYKYSTKLPHINKSNKEG